MRSAAGVVVLPDGIEDELLALRVERRWPRTEGDRLGNGRRSPVYGKSMSHVVNFSFRNGTLGGAPYSSRRILFRENWTEDGR